MGSRSSAGDKNAGPANLMWRLLQATSDRPFLYRQDEVLVQARIAPDAYCPRGGRIREADIMACVNGSAPIGYPHSSCRE